MHVLIVGAGVMGTCTAYYLSQRRNVKVTVIERTNVACASSGKAGGFLWSEGDGDLSKKSYQLHSNLAATLNGSQFYGYRTVHTYSVTMTSEENSGSVKQSKKVNDCVPWLDQQRVTHCDLLGMKEDTAQVHPYLFTNTLMTAALATGNVDLKTGSGVKRLVYGNKQDPTMVTGVLLDNGDEILADRVVLCLGPWSETFPLKKVVPTDDDGSSLDQDMEHTDSIGIKNDMIERRHIDDDDDDDDYSQQQQQQKEDDGGIRLPIGSVRAHSIVMRVPKTSPIGPQCLFTAILDGSKMYEPEIYPRLDHTVYMCGAQDNTVPLPASADLVQVDPAAISQLKHLAPQLSKHLDPGNEYMAAEQACYLPISNDGTPLVGKYPHCNHLYVSAGHSVWGILLAPVSGLMISELLVDERISCVDASLSDPMSYSFRLLILVTCCILQAVEAQVSTQNPLIWQTLVTPLSGTGYDYVANSTVKYYSQDFQTVYCYNDNFGHNERILLNVGDGCNLPTYDSIVYNNHGVSTFVKRQQLMGLVSRGGCSWSTKINNLQTLTQTNSIFKITGVLIYDNVIYNDTVAPIIQSKPSVLITSQWHSSQLVPTQRNISMMQDNDLPASTVSPFMAIYFASHQFGLDMLAKMNVSQSTASPSSNDVKQYIRLAPYFSDSAQEDNPSNTNTNNSNDNNDGNGTDSSDMDADELFGGGNRGYIAYLVAAVAGIVMAIILFRWCRNPRFGARQNTVTDPDLEAQVGMQQIEQPRPSDPDPSSIPIEKLDAMYPIISAGEVSETMKNTMCAICLDDFDPACRIRLLPCQHGFCVGCIDVWLTEKSSVCPICKHDCCETKDSDVDLSERWKLGPTRRFPPSSSSEYAISPTPTPTPNPGILPNVVSSILWIDEEDLGTTNRSPSPSPGPPPYEHDRLSLTSENQSISSHHATTTS